MDLRPTALALLLPSLVVVTTPVSAVADEPGHSLSLSGPAAATVGEPAVYTATGTVPEDVPLNRYLNVYSIPTSMVSTCPAEFTNAMQLADAGSQQGGDTVANHVQVEGDFSVPIAYTPRRPGQMLLCGYLHEQVETMATGSTSVAVAQAPAAEPPRATKAPTVVRQQAELVCRKGSWTGAPTAYGYRWTVDGKQRAGARSPRLTVTRSMKGTKVRCVVRAANEAGVGKATSAAHVVR